MTASSTVAETDTKQEMRDGVSLRTMYVWIIVGVLIFAGLQLYSTYSLTSAFQRVTEATENQISLEKAAHELMDASDYLTERAQRFTIDGDMRFLDEYFTEAFETNRREDAIARMSVVPESAPALEQLQHAMDDSVKLMDREYYAMRLVADAKGYDEIPEALLDVQLSDHDSNLSDHEKMERATEILLDDEYYKQKEQIRSEMQDSLNTLETLTRNTESAAIDDFHHVMSIVYVVIALQIIVMVFVIVLTVHLGINPVLKAVGRIKDDKPIRENGAREFRYLARAYNNLTHKLNRENELLKEISHTDALTGIRNRMALRYDYDSYDGREVTVMLLDLDKFKSINDFHGHDEGDRVLSETGKLLSDTFGKQYCYRYGGDEFLVILPDESEQVFNEKLESVMVRRPILEKDGEFSSVDYSVGCVHADLNGEYALRDLFSEADQRMYKAKRNKLRSDAMAGGKSTNDNRGPVGLESTGYTASEMKTLLDSMSGMYDLARVVDPIECRILEIGSDGTVSRKERCYGIWNAGQKCVNCTSALACQTGNHQEKLEAFDDQVYHIQSNPVTLRLPDGGSYDAVVELVNIEKDNLNAQSANDREAENKSQKAARYHAQHDSLTKALNPSAFSELSREAVSKNAQIPWTMVTGNIMDFRLVNTLFGSHKGNEVIVGTADLLKQIAQASHGLCGRLGGDQFAVLLPQSMYKEDSFVYAAQTLAEKFSSGQYTFRIHFGVYEMDDPSIPISVMCDRANTALRTIHRDLRQSVAYFDEAMMQESLFAQEIISGFDNALKEGQFQMYLQPLVIEDGRVLGAEALVRWRQPDGTVTMPADFIETLERAGLIYKLDMYIWECAVKQLSIWNGTPRQNLTISVNMSAKDLYFVDVYQALTDLVNRYQVPCNRLRVEITETALLDDSEKGNEIISRLQHEGFIVEIDDFGKGHSSLSLLKDIHADVLKIDMSLLREIDCKQRNRTILECIINMATSLGMEVIAEGVETETQLKLLTDMGCRHFQGYYFSRPISVGEFEMRFAVE